MTLEFRKNDDFENFLYDSGALEDCFIVSITPVPDKNWSTYTKGEIELLKVTATDWKAGSMAKYKKFVLRFENVEKWNFLETVRGFRFSPDHCAEGFEFKKSNNICFSIDVPAIFEVEAESVRVQEGEIYEKKIESCTS